METRLVNMPTTIHSFVQRKDGYDTIIINARLSYEQQRECFQHEMEHINNDDYEKEDVQQIESAAHKIKSGLRG